MQPVWVTGARVDQQRLRARLTKLLADVDRACENAISAKSAQLQQSAESHYTSLFERGTRDKSSSPTEEAQPHLQDYLFGPHGKQEMLHQVRREGGSIVGGWGSISYMNALVPLWRSVAGKNEGGGWIYWQGDTHRSGISGKPLWLILEQGRRAGHTFHPRIPSSTGKTDWLFWEGPDGIPHLRKSITAGATAPKPFITLAVSQDVAKGTLNRRTAAEGFAEYVVTHHLPGAKENWRVQLRAGTQMFPKHRIWEGGRLG